MKEKQKIIKKIKQTSTSQTAMKGGTYSIAITVIVLAILIAVNIFVQVLPTTVTQYDISAAKLYSVTSNTKVVVNALEKDVTIYWIVQAGEEDAVIEKLLDKYESLSGHLRVVKKNPDIYPTFAEKYTSETVSNNSLIVECDDRNRFIGFDDIYESSGNMYTGSNSSFDGEGAITSAIDNVVNSEQPKLYVLEGHGEAEMSTSFSEQIEKENMEIETFSLLNNDAVPEEADCVVIYSPTTDISEEEKGLLETYLADGGKLFVLAGPSEESDLTNLYSLLVNYGVEAEEGIVVDTNRQHYAFGQPYILMPTLNSDTITEPLLEENYYAIMPLAKGLTVKESVGGVTVTELLTTSEQSYSKKAGYELTTYEKEEGDADGPFALAVSIEGENESQIVWFTSSYFVEDTYNEYSSGANMDLAMNGISSMLGEREAVAIRSKSLNYNYLTISDSTASLIKTVMIGVFPIVYLLTGVCVVVKRRRRNEAN